MLASSPSDGSGGRQQRYLSVPTGDFMDDVVILSAVCTPVGAFKGAPAGCLDRPRGHRDGAHEATAMVVERID